MPNERKSADQQLRELGGFLFQALFVFLLIVGGFWLSPGWVGIPLLIILFFAFVSQYSQGDRVKANQDTQIVCPQCQTIGNVTTEKVRIKKGISGAKATGAVLTGGLSILATGLSRKEEATEARCSNCGSVWHF